MTNNGQAVENALLLVDRLTKVYRNQQFEITALKELTFQMEAGEILSVIGPSGCGKSTLLK